MTATSTQRSTPSNIENLIHDWKAEVIPGCFFVWFIREFDVTVYGEILDSKEGVISEGFRCVLAHSEGFPAGKETVMPIAAMEMLLSREQFDTARRMGWPGDEAGLNRVFGIPSN
jgi:hypothetical protein